MIVTLKGRKSSSKRVNVSHIVKANPPSKKEIVTIRLLIVLGIASMAAFLWWFIDLDHIGYIPLFILLTAALLFKLLRIIHEWYHYFSISVPVKPELKGNFTVDVFTTACPGEPHEMIINTLKAIKAIRYPHTSYLCDEGNDPILKEVCLQLGVHHVTRIEKTNAKAGNINNALKQSSGEICVVLDPDHAPVPEFLDQVIPYFQNPEIGFVQVVQAYHNRKESLIAKGSAEQTYTFYGPMMMCMHTYGTAQAIGANCTFRREALESIGGHAAGLSEDMHTAMQLHAKGWKSVYVPEILSHGLVPATLSAYYKQQLKWSRGTFELLFTTFPKLFRHFTWQQKIHYFTLPLYYLYGVFGLIDILVPVLALTTCEVPWQVNLIEFSAAFLPLFVFSLLIRQYAQRWLLEKHERGFHMIGGILRMGTWWIFTIGFIYTLLRIKVPYIPTPKDDKPQNNFILSLPNILACIISLAAIVYGLSIDWNPYSWLMAGFAFTNVAILGFIVIVGQEKFLQDIKTGLQNFFHVDDYIEKAKIAFWHLRHPFYNLLRNGALFIALLFVTGFALYKFVALRPTVSLASLAPPDMKNTGGFYTGIYVSNIDKDYSIRHVNAMETSMQTSFDIVSFYQAWGPESIEKFPDSLLHSIAAKGSIPMITWEPWTSTFPQFTNHPDLGREKKVCMAIGNGLFDEYLYAYAHKLRNYGKPVFLRFAHEPDNPAYPWSYAGENTVHEYITAWQHVVNKFKDYGVVNVTWVWNPWQHQSIETYFPGDKYVDWVSITCLNYGQASGDNKWYTFDELYEPYKNKVIALQKPIMLAEFGTTSYGGDQTMWMKDAIQSIQENHKEIDGMVFFYSDSDKNWATTWRPEGNPATIDWTYQNKEATYNIIKSSLATAPFNKKPFLKSTYTYLSPDHNYKSRHLKGKPGNFELMVDGKPFYIKGVAYNLAHDWRDGNYPLTRHQLEKDFKNIKAMGANAIRRYNPGIYDQNVLNIAHENDLKVLYGFWFDPKVDYYRDSLQVKKYIEQVEKTVEKYRGSPAILGWSIGNETWSLLKHYYSPPYLTKVRNEYVKMLEHLAQKIHHIDPAHPVFTSMQHARQSPGELAAYHQQAPSIDVIGINSYYKEQISKLHELTWQFDSTRAYLVAEFGPRGYWDPEYSKFNAESLVMEDSDYEKKMYYYGQWVNYIEGKKGYNIGGFASSWRDKVENMTTWTGITDIKGRFKPSYYALQEAYTGITKPVAIHNAHIMAPNQKLLPGHRYTFEAFSENRVLPGMKYEWYFLNEDHLGMEDAAAMEKSRGNIKVTITIPEKPSRYRLYLIIRDKHNNVVTASLPIQVQ